MNFVSRQGTGQQFIHANAQGPCDAGQRREPRVKFSSFQGGHITALQTRGVGKIILDQTRSHPQPFDLLPKVTLEIYFTY